MRFFRPERALARLLHHDPFCSPAFIPRPLTSPLSLLSRRQPHSEASSQVARTDRNDEMERQRHRRHRQLQRHNPFSLLSPFTSPFSSSFPSLFDTSPFSSFTPLPDMTVDITSTPTSYSVHAAVPGLKKEDINITVDDGVLTIEAERKETRGGQKEPTSSSTSSTQSAEEKTGEEKTAGTEGSPSSTASPTTEVDEDVNYHHVESFYGRVTRSIQLPDDARVDELTAKYEDGVIKIEVPRKKEQRKEAKKIQIQ